MTSPKLTGLFGNLFVFGDSISDYGSRLARLIGLLGVFEQPLPSGVTFSNANFNWQLGLRADLGLTTSTRSSPWLPANPFFQVTNPFVGVYGASPGSGSSYAIGGATSGPLNLITLSKGIIPHLLYAFLNVEGTGVQGQIRQALTNDGVRFASNELVTLWAGGNDLLVADQNQTSLSETLMSVLSNMRANLIALLREGDARQVLTVGLAPAQGLVDGVAYRMPYLNDLITRAQSAPADSYLKEWQEVLNGNGLAGFRSAFNAMVNEVQLLYPYANLITFDPEYETQWERFGDELGNFASNGINDTLSYAQAGGKTNSNQANEFLYFDTVHPTESGHRLLQKGINLTLQAKRPAIAASTLTNFRTGSWGNDWLLGTRANDSIRGGFGNDWITGGQGNDELSGDGGDDVLQGHGGIDVLIGGAGSDTLIGGAGADFFRFRTSDANGRDQDVITDFDPLEGDRLGIASVLPSSSLFNPAEWRFIAADRFSGQSGELRFQSGLLEGDVDGNAQADLRIGLSGIDRFDPGWIS